MTRPPDAFIALYDRADGVAKVELADEPRIDAAVTRWVESGRSHDTLLDLTLIDGREYKLLASQVCSWIKSTRKGRRRSLELENLYEAEEHEMRQELGMWE